LSEPLWAPSAERIQAAEITAFMRMANERYAASASNYDELLAWSIERKEEFWEALWDFCGVIASQRGERALVDGDRMPGARFFPDARLNFAANLLRRQGPGDAIVFRGEDRVVRRLSWDELRAQVAAVAAALRDFGIEAGDRVAGFMPNVPESFVAMLATASLGAVWSSCSPDFGARGVVDRFGQIEPKVLFCADGYFYKGREFDSLARVAEFLPQLASIEHVVVSRYVQSDADLRSLGSAQWLDDVLADHHGAELSFVQMGFNDPLYVLFSSGTTGPSKCIVHGVGGTLLKHLSEHRLLLDVRPGDRVFYFTTCGWMMWNWLASALASEATLLVYDGDPFHPGPEALFDFIEEERGTLFGVSAKYIDALRKAGADPGVRYRLPKLRTITSTGSPLVAEAFDYVYAHIKGDVCLSSISGGTDIVGCFVGGNPIGAVWRGEIQAGCLGMAVHVFDGDGQPVLEQKGELVCTQPFPSMPLGFWNDAGGSRYHAAYFERYPGTWHQGDYAEITPHRGVVIYGRSDATLNPGGVRIGTAEIYRVVENLSEVDEALVIGQSWQDDVRVILFVRLRQGLSLESTLVDHIRQRIRTGCSPRHVPAVILQVQDIPRTKSGKIVELAVRNVVHGEAVKNVDALANPEALGQFADRPELL
jgi:acetoacetyl-CoA synthetase